VRGDAAIELAKPCCRRTDDFDHHPAIVWVAVRKFDRHPITPDLRASPYAAASVPGLLREVRVNVSAI
jgi:hypothetical protein